VPDFYILGRRKTTRHNGEDYKWAMTEFQKLQDNHPDVHLIAFQYRNVRELQPNGPTRHISFENALNEIGITSFIDREGPVYNQKRVLEKAVQDYIKRQESLKKS
jgi:hypothetical protein